MKNKKVKILIAGCISATLLSAQSKDIKYPYTWTTETNPITKHIYSPDPSAKVFSDGQVWVFASHDNDSANNYKTMKDYHFFSTPDMKTWTDHGVGLSLDNITWADRMLWAPDACEYNGKYYLYAPAAFKIGVFVSDKPQGPYSDAIGHPLVPFEDCIDPNVFIDDDVQAYLYFSRKSEYCYVVKLKDNMIEIDGLIKELTNNSIRSENAGEPNFVEAPYVHKRNGIYYMSYAARRYKYGEVRNRTGHELICYATSKSPMGPFKYQGIIMDEVDTKTIHQAIINFKDQNWFFYHDGSLYKANGGNNENDMNFRRTMRVNKLSYNEDGSIKQIYPDEKIW